MKKYIIIIFASLLVSPIFSQQKDAKDLLDKASESIRKAGIISIGFDIDVFDKLQLLGNFQGTIKLKGDKFVLDTEDAVTWFDGKTQWTYKKDNEEVTISNPTEEEIQSINPYALLGIYKNGYNYTLGKTKNFQGKSVSEVQLKSTNNQDLASLQIYINPKTYHLLYLEAELKDGTRNQITIKDFKSGLNLSDEEFTFNKLKYPNAEIIDLR